MRVLLGSLDHPEQDVPEAPIGPPVGKAPFPEGCPLPKYLPPLAESPELERYADAPLPSEQGGFMKQFYDKWKNEAEDPAATTALQSWVTEQIEEHGIESREADVACGTSLCRAKFSFATAAQLEGLGRIDTRGKRVVASDPEVAADGIGMVVYYQRGENDPTL